MRTWCLGGSIPPLPRSNSVAHGEECIGHNLRGLPPRRVVVRAEVWPVAGRHTWLACPAAWVAVHESPGSQPLDKVIERRACGDILEYLRSRRVIEARRVAHNLRYLAPCHESVRAEVRQVV